MFLQQIFIKAFKSRKVNLRKTVTVKKKIKKIIESCLKQKGAPKYVTNWLFELVRLKEETAES